MVCCCFAVCARRSNFSLKAKQNLFLRVWRILVFPPFAAFPSSLTPQLSLVGPFLCQLGDAGLPVPICTWAVVLAWWHLETPCHRNCGSRASLRHRKWTHGVPGSGQDSLTTSQAVGKDGRDSWLSKHLEEGKFAFYKSLLLRNCLLTTTSWNKDCWKSAC